MRVPFPSRYYFLAATLAAILQHFHASARLSAGNDNVENSHDHDTRDHRILKQPEIGTFLAMPRSPPSIELDGGLIYDMKNVKESWMDRTAPRLVSGVSRISLPRGATLSGATVDLRGRRPSVVFKGRQPDGITLGNHSVLAVRVVAADDEYRFNETELSGYIFENGMVAQFEACSYGKFSLREADEREGINTQILDGVVTIKVDTSVSQGHKIMNNAITREIIRQFGVPPYSLADFVMYCLPPKAYSGVAYAYVNNWSSVYNNKWCNSFSLQMHEIGHNIGFAHSNEEEEYRDQSGIMGYSYPNKNGPKMCFNGAKSFQSRWYDDATVTIAPTETTNNSYVGRIYGVTDYAGDSSRVVVVKIDDISSNTDFYVSFNTKTDINSGTQDGPNCVMISTAGAEGIAYSPSTLLAKLSQRQTFTIDNFAGSGNSVSIFVRKINTNASPSFAKVFISYDDNADGADAGLNTDDYW